VTGAGGASYDIQFTLPRYLSTDTFCAAVTGSTAEGTSFASANCSQIAVDGALPTPVVNVTQYGADPSGAKDSTAAIAKALAFAQASGGGTVYFPAGTYVVGKSSTPGGKSIPIDSGPPVTLAGAGMSQSTLVETVTGYDIVGIKVDGVVVEDLGFDTATHGARCNVTIVANNTTLERVKLMDGSQTFSVYFAGPPGATPTDAAYNTGNQMLDSVITDSVNDDSLSFSFQQNGVIRNITHTGSRLALYIDQNVTVSDYQYSPNTQSAQQASDQNGFWITPPSGNITIRNFVSSGQGGKVGSSGVGRSNSNISIIGERLLKPGYALEAADVDGLTIKGGSLIGDGSGAGTLVIDPDALATNIVVDNMTLQAISFAPAAGASVNQAAFTNNIYEPFTPKGTTFTTTKAGGTVDFSATGGQFCNTAGGFQSGPNTTYTKNVGACAGN